MGVIFDLDQTLVDSSIAIDERRKRNWGKVYSLIPQFDIFKGIDSIINLLQSNNIPICIVTSSPRSYCQKVINNFGWNDIKLVCYHDTKYKKPHKEPIEKAISLLGVGKEHIVSIGDDIKDIVASNSAGVTSVGVAWGTNSSTNLKDADVIFTEVDQLKEFLINRYNLKR